MDGLLIFEEILGIVGGLIRLLGFLLIGYGIAHFVLNSYKMAVWQVQIALVLGFFGLLIATMNYASAGATGAFAIGAGVTFFISSRPKQNEEDDEEKKVDKKKKK